MDLSFFNELIFVKMSEITLLTPQADGRDHNQFQEYCDSDYT